MLTIYTNPEILASTPNGVNLNRGEKSLPSEENNSRYDHEILSKISRIYCFRGSIRRLGHRLFFSSFVCLDILYFGMHSDGCLQCSTADQNANKYMRRPPNRRTADTIEPPNRIEPVRVWSDIVANGGYDTGLVNWAQWGRDLLALWRRRIETSGGSSGIPDRSGCGRFYMMKKSSD